MKSRIKRHRITVQTPVETLAADGEPLVAWSDTFINEPADVTPTGGFETMRGRQLEAGTKAIFRVNYRAGYTNQMRIVHNGTNYGITYINQVDGLRHEIELLVTS